VSIRLQKEQLENEEQKRQERQLNLLKEELNEIIRIENEIERMHN